MPIPELFSVALIGQAWVVCPSSEVGLAPPDPQRLRVGRGGFPKKNQGAAVIREGCGCWQKSLSCLACEWRQLHITRRRKTYKLTHNKLFNISECLLQAQRCAITSRAGGEVVLDLTEIMGWEAGGSGAGVEDQEENPAYTSIL